MAVQKQDGLHTDVGESSESLVGKEFYFCTRNANGTISLCGDGGAIAGVISEGRIAGKHTSFNTRGNPILKVIAGSNIARGAAVQSDNDGKASAGSTKPFGIARNSADAGAYVEIATDTSR
jgi:hypothetical protein